MPGGRARRRPTRTGLAVCCLCAISAASAATDSAAGVCDLLETNLATGCAKVKEWGIACSTTMAEGCGAHIPHSKFKPEAKLVAGRRGLKALAVRRSARRPPRPPPHR